MKSNISLTREKRIKDSLPLLYKFVDMKYHYLIRQGVVYISKGEIISACYQGLNNAVERFDEKRNNDFTGYLHSQMEFTFNAYLREIDVLPVRMRRDIKKYNKACEGLTQKLNRLPTDEEIAKELNVDLKKVKKTQIYVLNSQTVDIEHEEDAVNQNVFGGYVHEEKEREVRIYLDMEKCLETVLKPDAKAVMELKFLQNLSVQEIAVSLWDKFSKTEKFKVNNLVKYSKIKLKKCMEEKGWELY